LHTIRNNHKSHKRWN